MNEVIVKSVEGILVIEVEICGEYFEIFCGDGFCIFIFLGSIVYNKVFGGVIIYLFIEVI